MPSASDILIKLYDKVVLKSNKLKAFDAEEVEEKKYDAGSSPFMKPNTLDTDYTGNPVRPTDIAPEKPYTTQANIGSLPDGGGGNAAAPLPSNASSEPFDRSEPSGEDEDEDKKKLMRTKDGEEFEVREQDETPVEPTEVEGEDTKAKDMELPPDPATTNPSMNAQQPGAADIGMGGMDAGMGGMDMGMEEEEKSPHELGRIYELKKIYARLTSIESYLSSEADPELTEIRKFVSQSIELFEIVASNIDSYQDKMEDIIISYYKFLKEIYFKIKDYYKEKSEDSL